MTSINTNVSFLTVWSFIGLVLRVVWLLPKVAQDCTITQRKAPRFFLSKKRKFSYCISVSADRITTPTDISSSHSHQPDLTFPIRSTCCSHWGSSSSYSSRRTCPHLLYQSETSCVCCTWTVSLFTSWARGEGVVGSMVGWNRADSGGLALCRSLNSRSQCWHPGCRHDAVSVFQLIWEFAMCEIDETTIIVRYDENNWWSIMCNECIVLRVGGGSDELIVKT